jgi:AcrR family transcriptional regulator
MRKMKGKSITGERDREATEKRLLDTIGKMIAEDGFEKIGINAIATQSGVSKILIYRYFGYKLFTAKLSVASANPRRKV